jgi:uncharacterized protein YhhL (DUF1145 family)
MTEASKSAKKLQWKWVGITIAFYLLFYVLPVLLLSGAFSRGAPGPVAIMVLAVWCFAGVFINAAVVAYLSKGTTLWEPVLGASVLVTIALAVEAFRVLISPLGERHSVFLHVIAPIMLWMALVFILSLTGAWFGKRAQKLWKKKPPEQN